MPVGTPQQLSASSGDYRWVLLSWLAPASGDPPSAYQVERQVNGMGNFEILATVAGQSYTDGAVTPESTYFYQVRAVSSQGIPGSSSESAQGTTGAIPPPSALAATRNPGPPVVGLTWSANGDTGLVFEIFRKVEGGAYASSPTLTTPGYALSATDMYGITYGTQYRYKVRAKKQVFGTWYYSSFCNEAGPVLINKRGRGSELTAAASETKRAAITTKHYRLKVIGWEAGQPGSEYSVRRNPDWPVPGPRTTRATEYKDFDDGGGADELNPDVEYEYFVTSDDGTTVYAPFPVVGTRKRIDRPNKPTATPNGTAGQLKVVWSHPASRKPANGYADRQISWVIKVYPTGGPAVADVPVVNDGADDGDYTKVVTGLNNLYEYEFTVIGKRTYNAAPKDSVESERSDFARPT